MNVFFSLLIGLLKANPQLVVSILEMLVKYLKDNPKVTEQLIDQLTKTVSAP